MTATTKEDEQRGRALERIVAHFSSRFFLKDFVFLNPTYESSRGVREVTDLLFVLNNDCIVISVKGTDGKQKDLDRLRLWLRKKVLGASKNAKTAIRRLARVSVTAENLWGEKRVFERGTLRPMCGVALVECSQEPFESVKFNVEQPTSAVPIHFISINDFLNLVVLLGSVWDFFNYFEKRGSVQKCFDGINQERPLISYYTLLSKTDFEGFPAENKDRLAELHQLHLIENIGNYTERDRLAGYVNAVVHQLHDRDPEIGTYTPPELIRHVEPEDKRSAYLQMASMLNNFPTSNKANIGRQLEELMNSAKRTGKSGCFAFQRFGKGTVFVFACFTGFTRTERIEAICRFLPPAKYRYNLDEALGIAYDADSEETGFDVVWLRSPVDSNAEVRELADQLFPNVETMHANPFGVAQPYTSKAER